MTFLAAVHHFSIDVFSVVVGLLLAILVFVVAEWVLGMVVGAPARPIAAVLAVLTFLACVF